MRLLNLWRKCSNTEALEKSSGFETIFFESVYRVTYITGQSSSEHSMGYSLYSNLVKLMISYILFGELWHSLTEYLTLDQFAASINVILIQAIAIYRYKNLRDHKDFYKNLAISMDSPYFDISTERRKKLVKEWAQRQEIYLKLLLGLGSSTLLSWFIFPLMDGVQYNLIIGIRLPFDYKSSELYPFAYIFVVIAFGYVSYFVMVTDSIMQAHLIHLLCQFSVLADCFQNCLNDCSAGFEGITKYDLVHNKKFAEKYKKRLGDLVKQHKFILRHTLNLRDILSGPMLGQLAASGTIICFVGYQSATTIGVSIGKCLMSCLFLSYNVFALYIICKWCEDITTKSHKIGEAIYCSGWECGVFNIRGVRSTLVFVIARANKPVVLTAGGMYNLSIASYALLIKASYSALTMLLRLNHN